MSKYTNPFEYEAAANLPPEMILDVYIEDFNYTRFIQSTRNIFLMGDRGSGKSMTLRYNSFELSELKAKISKEDFSYDYIGIYIPCNTPLTHKQEHTLLPEFQASAVSEHFFVLSIVYKIAETFLKDKNVCDEAKNVGLKNELEYVWNDKLPRKKQTFEAVSLYIQRKVSDTQLILNQKEPNLDNEKLFSFSSSVLPFLILLRKLRLLSKSHFILMIDDAHDLNKYQRKILNSWIAYRDHSLYSFKVAAAKVSDIDYKTATGGSILDGHDFISLDMEGDFQNQFSRFGKLAREIINKRLQRIGIEKSAEEYFPVNSTFKKDLEASRIKAKKNAESIYKNGTYKQISDYVYKFARAEYFRSRSSKANRPPYSGFDIIVHLSTGVIRNLLEPCYKMYDDIYSKKRKKQDKKEETIIQEIPPAVQTEVILEMSSKTWNKLENLEKYIENCSKQQAGKIYSLFDRLAILFSERLKSHSSEPRAIVFTISGISGPEREKIDSLLSIARKAQLLYVRSSVAKDYGRQETYYVPNRMLMPNRGLDPVGQHARVSLKARDIINAANGRNFPFVDQNEKYLFSELYPHE